VTSREFLDRNFSGANLQYQGRDRIWFVTTNRESGVTAPLRVGIAEVAREAGVSIALVSLALNNKGRVSAQSVLRIREIADRLGYKANRAAASLRSGRSRTIGFVLSGSGDDDWTEQWSAMSGQILLGVVLAANRNGYSVVVLPPNSSAESIGDLDGLVMSESVASDSSISEAVRLGVPVLSNERPDASIAVNIDSGYRAMTRIALDHFQSRGARRPALLTEPLGLYSNELSEKEYLAWCGENSIEPIVARGRHDRSDLVERVDEIIARGCDAIYSFYEEGAEILSHLRQRGIRVPEDIALIAAAAYSDDANRVVGVSTTVYHPELHTKAPMDALIDVIEGRVTPPVTIDIGWEFEIHESS
jgi:DNA-binding LacI/PurR family transcriptional regulator